MIKLRANMPHYQRSRRRLSRGQSMVEVALTFPVLLLILAGAIEIGMYYNTYLNLMDATREGARYSVNGSPIDQDAAVTYVCEDTKDFFKKTACLTRQNLDLSMPGRFDPTHDDILVSLLLFKNGQIVGRYDAANWVPGQNGWSWCESMAVNYDHVGGCNRATTRFPNSVLQGRLDEFISDQSVAPTDIPKAAYVLVEVYHIHHQFLGLIPPNLPFLPQEVVMHAYAIMPVPAAASAEY